MPAIALLAMLRRFWPYALGGVALIGAYLWIDHRGYQRGVAHVEARDAKAAARIAAASERLRAADQAIAGQLATDQQTQTRTFTEIRNVASPIIYRSTGMCLGADAVQLLDRAAAAANSGAAGEPADRAGAAAAIPAQ